jgi:hypothetical protein
MILEPIQLHTRHYRLLLRNQTDHTDISILEMVQSDGSIVTEKVTTYLNGRKSVEVTTTRK